MEIFVSAGEASSDIHCAHLIEALRSLAPKQHGEIGCWGLGGDRLEAAGAKLLMHNRQFSVGGGPLEVASKLPLRSRFEHMVEKELFARRPIDVALLVDNGELNLRLASLLNFFGTRIVYFIPPKLWVWRHSRIEDIEHHVDLVLSILPFEEPIYKSWEVPFKYVGNPLIDEVDTALTAEDARENLGVARDAATLAVFVGSRHNEVRLHTEIFGEGVRRFLASLPEGARTPKILLPAAQAIEPEALRQAFASKLSGIAGAEVVAVKGQSHACLRASRAALVKSGTSTLEAGLLQTPMVLAYHSSRSSELFFKHVVRYRGFVGLVNLFLADDAEDALGWGKKVAPVVPELILSRCTPEAIAGELKRVWVDGPHRTTMLSQLNRVKGLLSPPAGSGTSPIEVSARAILELIGGRA